MSSFRSPPPPLAPPPSRETDVAFGIILILTALLLLVVFGCALTRVPRGDSKQPSNSSTTSKATTYRSDAPSAGENTEYYEDADDTDGAFKLSMALPTVVLRPLKL